MFFIIFRWLWSRLDAFAPVKLQLSIYGQPVITHCRAWQEIRLVHIIKLAELRVISEALSHSKERIEAMAIDLTGYTKEVFCHVTQTSVGQAWQGSLLSDQVL